MSSEKYDKERGFVAIDIFSDDLVSPDISARISDEDELRELAKDPEIRIILEQNMEIAHLLRGEILNEEAAEEPESGSAKSMADERKEILREKKLNKIQKLAELRIQAVLEDPIRTRAQAIKFLNVLIKMVDYRTGLDSTEVRNSEEHVEGTISLVSKINELKTEIGYTGKRVTDSLKKSHEGVAECTAENAQVLNNVLLRASEALRYLRSNEEINPSQVSKLGETSHMKPSKPVFDYFLELKSARCFQGGVEQVKIARSILTGHLRGLVQKTGMNVEMDTRYSALEFDRLNEVLSEIANNAAMAESIGNRVSDGIKKKWEAAVFDTIYILTQVMARTNQIYDANADEFIGLIDYETLEKKTKETRDQEKNRKKEIEERRRTGFEEDAVIEKVGRAVLGLFKQEEPRKPLVSIAKLTVEQKALKERINRLARIKERRRKMMR